MIRQGKRFTLVEMMIVCAIIMVLTSIALPNVYEMQLKARLAEQNNIEGIMDSMVAYELAFDVTTAGFSINPRGLTVINKTAVAWVTSNAAWNRIAWMPDGNVRCTYLASMSPTLVSAFAYCDVDGDTYYNRKDKVWNKPAGTPEGQWYFTYPNICENAGIPIVNCY